MSNLKGKHIQSFLRSSNYLSKRGVFYDEYDEPTYLGFWIEFPDIVQPNNIASQNFDELPNGLLHGPDADYSAERYLRNINEPKRAKLIANFRQMLRDLTTKTPYYITEIGGIDSIYDLVPGQNFRGDAEISLELLEGIDTRISAMFDFYRKAAYDEVYHRWLLPDIMRNFRMNIYITEFRRFHIPREVERRSVEGQENRVPRNSGSEYFLQAFDRNFSIFKFELSNCEFDLESFSPSWKDGLNNTDGGEAITNSVNIKVGNIKESNQYTALEAIFGENLFRIDSANLQDRGRDDNKRRFSQDLYNKINADDENPDDVYNNYTYRDGHLGNDNNRSIGEVSEDFKRPENEHLGNDNNRSIESSRLNDFKRPEKREGFAGLIQGEAERIVQETIDGARLGNIYGLSLSTLEEIANDPYAAASRIEGAIRNVFESGGPLNNIYDKIPDPGELSELNERNIDLDGREPSDRITQNVDLDGNQPNENIPNNIDFSGNDSRQSINNNINLDGVEPQTNIPGNIDLDSREPNNRISENVELSGNESNKNIPDNVGLTGNESQDNISDNIELGGNQPKQEIDGNANAGLTGIDPNREVADNIDLDGNESREEIDGNIGLTGNDPNREVADNIDLDGNEPIENIPSNVGLTGTELLENATGNINLSGTEPNREVNNNINLTGNESKNEIDDNIELRGNESKNEIDDNIDLTGNKPTKTINDNINLGGNEPKKDIDGNVNLEGKEVKTNIDENINLSGQNPKSEISDNINLIGDEIKERNPGNVNLSGEKPKSEISNNIDLSGKKPKKEISLKDANLTGEEPKKNISKERQFPEKEEKEPIKRRSVGFTGDELKKEPIKKENIDLTGDKLKKKEDLGKSYRKNKSPRKKQ